MTRRRITAGIAGLGVLLVLGALVFVSTGSYNVAASTPHTRLTRWLLNTVQERSVAVRADEIPSPPPLDSGMVRHGFEEYNAMCAACHGAPGMERGAVGKGMNPEPPDLAEEVAEWSDRELFWITKHGIKLAGMPAFGITHSDEELWGVVAFLRRLEHVSPEEYRRMAADADAHAEPHGDEVQPQVAMHGTVESPHAATQEASAAPMEHAHPADAGRPRAGAPTPSQPVGPSMDHTRMQRREGVAERPAADATQIDTEATEKLKALAAGLMRDPIVMGRIRTDSALRRRWEDEDVRRQLTTPRR
jgi:mono/diheme cytochrome c family protein